MRNLLGAAVAATFVLLSACGGDPNCESICSSWKECAAANLDLSGCTQACDQASAEQIKHAEQTADCWQCMSTRTCAEENIECIDECWGVQGFSKRQ